jgi:hypothetical protein
VQRAALPDTGALIRDVATVDADPPARRQVARVQPTRAPSGIGRLTSFGISSAAWARPAPGSPMA